MKATKGKSDRGGRKNSSRCCIYNMEEQNDMISYYGNRESIVLVHVILLIYHHLVLCFTIIHFS